MAFSDFYIGILPYPKTYVFGSVNVVKHIYPYYYLGQEPFM